MSYLFLKLSANLLLSASGSFAVSKLLLQILDQLLHLAQFSFQSSSLLLTSFKLKENMTTVVWKAVRINVLSLQTQLHTLWRTIILGIILNPIQRFLSWMTKPTLPSASLKGFPFDSLLYHIYYSMPVLPNVSTKYTEQVPVLTFVSAAAANEEPRSCFTFYSNNLWC